KRPALFINAMLFCQPVYKMWRNYIAELLEHSVFCHSGNAPFFYFAWPSLSHDRRIIAAFLFSMGG
ncbi:MAG: hypothetical protein Q7J98_00450, partial [Kiritimatiellia bacterium]|nr:hypothetical protein [Kiritimatiellia bacterium]